MGIVLWYNVIPIHVVSYKTRGKLLCGLFKAHNLAHVISMEYFCFVFFFRAVTSHTRNKGIPFMFSIILQFYANTEHSLCGAVNITHTTLNYMKEKKHN